MIKVSQKNGKDFFWTFEQFRKRIISEPYDYLVIGASYELDSPDGSTTFLLLFGGFDENSFQTTFCGLETPTNCLRHGERENPRPSAATKHIWRAAGMALQKNQRRSAKV